ncbi:MAG: methylated-DNA--[protein]-cysteine S-methyltransferase [Gammaproteobacteria bacterium]
MTLHESIAFTRWDSPLGPMRLAASPQGLLGAWFDGDRHGPAAWLTTCWQRVNGNPLLDEAARQLQAYFDQTLRNFELPLDLRLGTGFQQRAWQALLGIDYGATITYGTLAARLDNPAAARAAGAAIGRNPLSIIVPCHRVLGASGALTGYAGGLERKVALLRLEGALI